MKKHSSLYLALAMIFPIIATITAGCGKKTTAVTGQEQVSPSATQLPGRLRLFFVGDDGRLRLEDRDVPAMPTAQLSRIRLVVDELLAGSRQGLASPFPFSTSVQSVFLDRAGNAYVDLSPPPSEFSTGTDSEILLTYAVVNSIVANCPEVLRVQLLFGGREVQTLGHLNLSAPLRPQADFVNP